ncbi:hypothetical protein RO3G_05262 [Lichtheimia corymbifera JMRC:FSU:9682]|uniref:Ribosome maturation protein SDO1/SBDS N-terminal domain-containing protein n=1 Tax=Lichtheimia corymbifera JMRC:FSU:9682 TaxID=1263082 RepID=A0A068S3I0_9FUNG|nr:hypothetical protein RO3G_05262 [Lichtheimia corymbifera JMRC:FSU:9682]
MSATKVVYKSDNDQEFFVFTNPGEVSKWRKDKSIPLVDVVQSFDVFTTPTGSQTGTAERPSKGILESAFNTSKKEDVVRQIVEVGEEKNM